MEGKEGKMVEKKYHGRLRGGLNSSGSTGISRGSMTVRVVMPLSIQVGMWEKA